MIVLLQQYPINQIAKWVVEGVSPAQRTELSFAEYVHFVGFFSMFSKREMVAYFFARMDAKNFYYLT
jgi:hypothetical protein